MERDAALAKDLHEDISLDIAVFHEWKNRRFVLYSLLETLSDKYQRHKTRYLTYIPWGALVRGSGPSAGYVVTVVPSSIVVQPLL